MQEEPGGPQVWSAVGKGLRPILAQGRGVGMTPRAPFPCPKFPRLPHMVLKQVSFGRFFRILFYENRRLQLPKCCKS